MPTFSLPVSSEALTQPPANHRDVPLPRLSPPTSSVPPLPPVIYESCLREETGFRFFNSAELLRFHQRIFLRSWHEPRFNPDGAGPPEGHSPEHWGLSHYPPSHSPPSETTPTADLVEENPYSIPTATCPPPHPKPPLEDFAGVCPWR